jgi:DNA-binding transcriptional regulator YiaG
MAQATSTLQSLLPSDIREVRTNIQSGSITIYYTQAKHNVDDSLTFLEGLDDFLSDISSRSPNTEAAEMSVASLKPIDALSDESPELPLKIAGSAAEAVEALSDRQATVAAPEDSVSSDIEGLGKPIEETADSLAPEAIASDHLETFATPLEGESRDRSSSLELPETEAETAECLSDPEGIAIAIENPSTQNPLEIVDSFSEVKDSHSLTQSDLANRLQVSSSTLHRHRSRSDFSEWSKVKDPEAAAWRFDPKSNLFDCLD